MLWACANLIAQSTVSGTIIDKTTGARLPFVTIYNQSNQQGISTDIMGNFTIIAVMNEDSLRINYLGYEDELIVASTDLEIQLQQETFTLDNVIVSANREQEQRSETPITISSISSNQINDTKPTTIDEVINQTPGINMVDLGSEQHTMSIRRPIDYGASYLYLEDGIPIRTSGVFNHNALLEINMANVNSIEIIRGPASSIYGSEAIGGAINFISKKPSLQPSIEVGVQGNNIGYKRTNFNVSTTIAKKLGIRMAGYYANQQNGVTPHSDFSKLTRCAFEEKLCK